MQVQDGMKAAIQELLSGERVGTVRRALAMAAAAIARICIPANQWPSLLPWLHGCTQSPSEAQRETALMLICSLIDTIGKLPSLIYTQLAGHRSLTGHATFTDPAEALFPRALYCIQLPAEHSARLPLCSSSP